MKQQSTYLHRSKDEVASDNKSMVFKTNISIAGNYRNVEIKLRVIEV